MSYSTPVQYKDLPARVKALVSEFEVLRSEQEAQTGEVTVFLQRSRDLLMPEDLRELLDAEAIVSFYDDGLTLTFATVDEEGREIP